MFNSKWLAGLCFGLLVALAAPLAARAAYVSISVTTASTQIFAANDVGTKRNYLFLQNVGTNPVWCALGTSNAATTSNGIYMGQYGYFEVPNALGGTPNGSSPGNLIPGSDVACISINGGASVIGFDF